MIPMTVIGKVRRMFHGKNKSVRSCGRVTCRLERRIWKAQPVRGMKHAPILFHQHRGVTKRVPVTEDQIRTLAFYLWEADGSPDGRSDEFWENARQRFGDGGEVSAAAEPLPSNTEPVSGEPKPKPE
jgi:hypothetical protein